MRRISIFLTAGVIAIAIYVGVSSIQILSEPDPDETTLMQLNYDAYAVGINTVLYDASGNINYTLQAERQVHFDDDSMELDKPYIRLFENGNSRWNIVANSGWVTPLLNYQAGVGTATIQTIELSGAIEVYSLDEMGNRMQMLTDSLTVNPHDKTIETDQPVTVVSNSFEISSTGMHADLNQDSLVLKREVQGTYEASPN